MKTSTPTAGMPMPQTWPVAQHGQAGWLAAQSVDILLKDVDLPHDSTRHSRRRVSAFVTNFDE
jgi:hypothetical protein